MKREHIENDEISIITRIVEERLRYFRKYIGLVQAINPDGSVIIHSDEFGTTLQDPTSWLVAFTGTKMQSSVPPKIGQWVEFEFNQGTPDSVRFTCLSPLYISVLNEGTGKYIIFENSLTQVFKFDIATQTFTLQNGVVPVEKMPLGETLKSKLESLIDSINDLIDQITLLTVICSAPATASSTPVNSAAFLTIKTTLIALKTSLLAILSVGNKSN